MDHEFWLKRWRQNMISFHEGRENALLSRSIHRLNLKPGDRIFVPLCGKAKDLDWLLKQGFRVAGIELHQAAVAEVFQRMGLGPEATRIGPLTRFKTDQLELFAGDFFELHSGLLGQVNAIYDRAALVALPADMRQAYAQHLMALTDYAPQLLICFDYDQSQMDGPPFSVNEDEIRELYGNHYRRERAAKVDISGPLSQRCSGSEIAWLLSAEQARE